MALTYNLAITKESERVIDDHARRPADARAALRTWLRDILTDAEQQTKLAFEPYSKGGQTSRGGDDGKIQMRSRMLRNAVTFALDRSNFRGWYGLPDGAGVIKYGWLLTDEKKTIVPKNANHLWIPIADNLTASGVTRMTPREAMNVRGPRGGRAIRIFTSKKGNLVAMLPKNTGKGRKTHARGERKGQRKMSLLFVLKDRVEVQGRGVLERVAEQRRQYWTELGTQRLYETLTKGSNN